MDCTTGNSQDCLMNSIINGGSTGSVFSKQLLVVDRRRVADELRNELSLSLALERSRRYRPRSDPHIGIFNGDFVLQVSVVEFLEFFNNVQRLSVHETVH